MSVVSLLADLLIAVLLVATILSCVALSRRITRLKADEANMRRTIGELVFATENAERAIAGLRATLGECDRTLADRLRTAERYAADLAEQVEAGTAVMTRIAQIVGSTRASPSPARAEPEPSPTPAAVGPNGDRLGAAAAAAQALSERARQRLERQAA